MVKAIFLDLDGTLLTTEKKVSDYTMAVLRRVSEKGIYIVPCSGRRKSDIQTMLGKDFPARYLIGANGAVIFDKETREYLLRSAFSIEEAQAVIELAKANDAFCGCMQGEGLYLDAGFADRFPERMARMHGVVLCRDLAAALKESGEPITKITITKKNAALPGEPTLMERYRETFPNLTVTTSILNKGQTDEHVEVGSKNSEKDYAMRWLCEKLGISIEETAAFGDSLNDVSMLKAAGVSFVMENGSDEVKAIADRIAGDNDADGVAKAIEAYLMDE